MAAKTAASADALERDLEAARIDVYRRHILAAAEDVFADHGFERATMRDIAARAGVAVGSIYNAFGGKATVYDAVHQRHAQTIAAAAAEAAAAEGTRAVIRAGVDMGVRYFVAHPGYLRVILHQGTAWSQGDYATDAQRAMWQQGLDLLTEAIAAGATSGELRASDPATSARVVMALFQVVLADWLAAGANADAAGDLVDELETLILRVLLREPAAI